MIWPKHPTPRDLALPLTCMAIAGPSWVPPSGGFPVTPLEGIDVVVIVLYFVVVISVAIWASRGSKPSLGHGVDQQAAGYFLAAESVPWPAVAASLWLSNIGAEHFLGLCGTAASIGIAVGFFEVGAVPTLLVLGYVALPAFAAGRLFTTPELATRRFGPWAGSVLVGVSLALYVFTKISATLYAGQVILQQLGGLDPWASAAVLVVACAAYAGLGGLAAVVYTEAAQAVVLLAGGCLVLALGIDAVGGVSALHTALAPPVSFTPNASAAAVAAYPDWNPAAGRVYAVPYEGYSRWGFWRPADDAAYPWPGLSTGYFVIGLWYWATDQSIVQRGMAARNLAHARAGAVAASWLKLLPLFLMVVPGMIARVLMASDGVVPPTVPSSAVPARLLDAAFPWLVARVVPAGPRGVVVAAALSALMSSLASVFNSSATLLAMDVVGPCARPARPGDPAAGAAPPPGCCRACVLRLGRTPTPAVPDRCRRLCRRGEAGPGALGEGTAILPASAREGAAILPTVPGDSAGGDAYGDGDDAVVDAGLVWVGRLAVAGMGATSLLWLPVIPLLGDQLFAYVQKPPAFLAGPVLALYATAVLWPGARPAGAALCLAVGLTSGAVRFAVEAVLDASGQTAVEAFGRGSAASLFFGVHYLVYAGLSFAVSCALVVVGSVLLPGMRCGARISGTDPCSGAGRGTAEPLGGGDRLAELDELCVWQPGTYGRVLRRQRSTEGIGYACDRRCDGIATHAMAVGSLTAAIVICAVFV